MKWVTEAILIVDSKVVSTPTMVRNGAIASIDFLEQSKIPNVPFYAGFLKIILNI